MTLFLLTLTLTLVQSLDPLALTWQYEFLQGFKEGIQVDPSAPSNCIKSYPDISNAFVATLASFSVLNVHMVFELIKNLNTFITTFVSSYDVCNYSSISQRYFVDRQTIILNILVNATKNIQLFIESIQYLIMSIQYKDTYGTGLYLAKVVRYGLGISL